MMELPRWVAVGKVTRTHGVRGCVKVFPYGETLQQLQPGGQVFVATGAGGAPRPLTIASLGRHKRLLLICFDSIDSTDQAQALVGCDIQLPQTHLPPTEPDEYYHYQLLGLRVRSTDGRQLGTLTSILETGPHDVYVVTDENGRELLLPAVADVILEIDLKDRGMVVDPPQGLLDDL